MIGFVPGSLVWIAGFLRLNANQSWGFIILAGIFFFALFHLILDRYLSLPMYPGMFSVPGLY